MDEAMDTDAARTTLQEGVPRPGFGAMLGAKAFVVVVSSRQFGRLRVIGSSAVTVGRGKSCGLRVTDPAVSTVHCRITSRAGRDRILEDCGSTNGTFVNGRRIDAPVELRYGDRIRIGSTIVRFYVEEVPEKPRG